MVKRTARVPFDEYEQAYMGASEKAKIIEVIPEEDGTFTITVEFFDGSGQYTIHNCHLFGNIEIGQTVSVERR